MTKPHIKDVNIAKTFLTGLVTVLPIVVTIYLLIWLGILAESVLGGVIRVLIPAHLYVPGMGLVVGVALIFLIGLLMHAWVVRRFFGWSEGLLYRIPIISSVYGAVRDFLQFVTHSHDSDFSEVVAVDVAGMQLIGFVTRPDATGLPEGMALSEEHVLVYLPLSYQIGGYTVWLPRTSLRPIDMTMRDAMTFALTAGVASPRSGRDQRSRLEDDINKW